MMFDHDQLAPALLAGLADALVVADSNGVIRVWNQGAERLFGFTQAEAIGRSLDLIIPSALRARHWAGYGETMRTGQSRYGAGEVLAVPALHKDGTRLSVEFTIVALRHEAGDMAGIAAIMRDVTGRYAELRALRQELASLKRNGPA